MKILCIIGLIGLGMVFQTKSLFAAPQMSDTFIYNGLRYGLSDMHRHGNVVFPMESFFAIFPQKRPQPNIVSPNLSRGYLAAFEITENQMWVIAIRIHESTTRAGHRDIQLWRDVVSEIFDGQDRVKVEWFTGAFVIPERERWSQDQNYLLIVIESGNIIDEITLTGRDRFFWDTRFELFENHDEYQRALGEMSGAFLEFFVRLYEEHRTETLRDEMPE